MSGGPARRRSSCSTARSCRGTTAWKPRSTIGDFTWWHSAGARSSRSLEGIRRSRCGVHRRRASCPTTSIGSTVGSCSPECNSTSLPAAGCARSWMEKRTICAAIVAIRWRSSIRKRESSACLHTTGRIRSSTAFRRLGSSKPIFGSHRINRTGLQCASCPTGGAAKVLAWR